MPASLPRAEDFIYVLSRAGIPATVRVRRGIDIDAGCGQLADAASKEKAAARLELKLSNSRPHKLGELEQAPQVGQA